jgi:2-hydroxycyclohexanecarboxyl-CoA dehydrogenase
VGSLGETVYAGAKGGLIAFTKSLARETARYQHQRQLRLPGADRHAADGRGARQGEGRADQGHPAAPPGPPEEVADAIVFFARPARRYVTGQVLSVSGGLTMAG